MEAAVVMFRQKAEEQCCAGSDGAEVLIRDVVLVMRVVYAAGGERCSGRREVDGYRRARAGAKRCERYAVMV